MAKDQSTLESIHHQSNGSLDACEGQSKIAQIMYKYGLIIDGKSNQKLNHVHTGLAEEEPEHLVEYGDKESQEIINESKERVQYAKATVDELLRKFELEQSSLNTAIDDLRQKAALLRGVYN